MAASTEFDFATLDALQPEVQLDMADEDKVAALEVFKDAHGISKTVSMQTVGNVPGELSILDPTIRPIVVTGFPCSFFFRKLKATEKAPAVHEEMRSSINNQERELLTRNGAVALLLAEVGARAA